jgi:sarcosine oxidase subunit gamma
MAELTRLHPLEQIEAELAGRSNPAVTITAEPYVAMVDVRLPADVSGTELLGARLPTTPNTWEANDAVRAIWLGPDELLLTSTAHTPDELTGRVRETVRPLGGTVVDVSAQRIGVRLTGRRVRDVLAKGCSIDLHPRVFGRGSAAQTTIGQAGVILLALSDAGSVDRGAVDRGGVDRHDYLVLVRSSFAGYLADWLLDAAQEFSTEEFADPTTDPTSSQE